jgi:disulfide oxidoreductase YuzD
MPPLVRVTVLDDAKAEKCEAHCGLEFSSPQAVEQVTGLLGKLYGETVKLEYLDLAKAFDSRLYPEIVQRIRTESLPLPLLLINGNLRISGYFDIHLLQSVIQAELEMEL